MSSLFSANICKDSAEYQRQLFEQYKMYVELADRVSQRRSASADWKEKARSRIKGCQVVAVICGEHTDKATGVSIEIRIACLFAPAVAGFHGW